MSAESAPPPGGDREAILGRVHRALSGLPRRAAYPGFDDGLPVLPAAAAAVDLWGFFAQRLRAVNGEFFATPAELAARLRAGGWMRGCVDPAWRPRLAAAFGDGFTLGAEFDRGRIDEVDFGVTAAAGAIAETGTVILTDRGTWRRLVALAPWVHVAVVPEDRIYRTVGEALAVLGDDPNVIWATGPSKTADVEGILIEGVHGPGAQFVLRVPAGS